MNNEYEGAAVIELGLAQDVVLGEKVVGNWDILTGELGVRYVDATGDD